MDIMGTGLTLPQHPLGLLDGVLQLQVEVLELPVGGREVLRQG